MPDQNGSARPGAGIFSLVPLGRGLACSEPVSPYPLPEGEGNHDLPHLKVIRAASNRDPSSDNTPRTSTFASFFRSVTSPLRNSVAEPTV